MINKIKFLLLSIIILLFENEIINYVNTTTTGSYTTNTTNTTKTTKKAEETKNISVLLWSGFSWAGYGTQDFTLPNYLGQHVKKKKCPVNCLYRNDRIFQSEVDAILFEGQPFASWSYTFLKDPPYFPQKEIGQLFINFGYEHEKYFPLVGHNGYLRHMDINNTFRHSDQVQSTFACSWGSGEGGNISNFLREPVPFKKKNKLVGFMSTNCNSGGAIYRTCYIIDMMKHMQVDALGSCLHNRDLDSKDFPHEVFADLGDSLKIKEKVLSTYKFSLAFENNNITDYVTEKVYTSLLSGSIPIYMGSPNIDEWVPEKSIIKTDDFKSPKDLADYLKFLADNETAYNEYFNWKKKPLPKSFIEKYERCMFYDSDCRVCMEVNKQLSKLDVYGFRERFGEPTSVFRQKKILSLNSGSCIKIAQKNVPSINGRFTVLFWLQINDDVLEEKKLISFGGKKIEISITPIWKRFYLKVCISDKCSFSESPILVSQWKHIGITVGKESSANSHTSSIKFYFDGELDSSMVTVVDADGLDTSPMEIGCNTQLNWSLDDLTLWRTDLDNNEVALSKFKKYRGDEPNLFFYATFNGADIRDYSINKESTFVEQSNAYLIDYTDKKLILKV
ncbi:hypothetical protein DICPUDRAFT_57337 [Dictyostelium purpureum]|uniref:Fucosyltransferase n=1 Tax=Dictyostelium purpureum TaxID=5786 RepID=F0ZVJ8_DICPU|nr:uncharacterized protein DICPUDRAFT_57337 [Dictyostelium purpureum]EGC32023.1 hypothetical protein DICPUDRAFT_57337 [Dictyostelium purpureum]|eukprot:XP_003291441.1 hypothetical protein DICPUDRAFT_57337 [Dictyostelium purpureum]